MTFPHSVSLTGRRNSKFYWSLTATDKTFPPGNVEDRKVLLVDDNLPLLELTAQLFHQLGFEVVTASSGDKALEILQQTSDIDVLFSDVVMPGLDGIQLGHEASKLIPYIKVILVSGFPNPESIVGHGNVHDFDFLSKPYRIADIAKILAKKQ